ncbi:uncharacterized protein LOC129786061 isoform X2 [Lutzomyia longipalpis]|uniref:uncharacterized protein LOC129786061 isoform X2 n=1 Tax=Lutzomyia longipalpis TaxID=7200 RepID=UPI002483868C|nr:uncharacterized protein LOC129786061 isoform X2 [Lutzomyia longipalpis]
MANSNLTTTELQEKYSIYRDKGFGFVTQVPTEDFVKSLEDFHFKNQLKGRGNSSMDQKDPVIPVITEPVIHLYIKYLEYKNHYGSCVEKEIYRDMAVEDFIERLLVKAWITDKRSSCCTTKVIHAIGTEQESPSFAMKDYLTCDERKLASFISLSTKSGNKIIIGACNPQLNIKGLFDYQDIVISKSQNTKQNGYGVKPKRFSDSMLEITFNKRQIWCQFYQSRSLIYKHFDINQKRKFSEDRRFIIDPESNQFFDCSVLSKRYTIMIDAILLDSEARAKEMGKFANICISKADLQMTNLPIRHEKVFMETFDLRLMVLSWSTLFHVKSISFIGFNEEGFLKHDGIVNVEGLEYSSLYNKHPLKGIKIYFLGDYDETNKEEDTDISVKVFSKSNLFQRENLWIGQQSWISRLLIITTRFDVVNVGNFIRQKREILEENIRMHRRYEENSKENSLSN